ncbi:hypothetical protein P7M42_14390 [Vibrio parahaemolyticus]|nr:hypothetical protein [Vibrio parahaemolyticus]HCE2311129.1 hypothetical protein [Vibrio parahaemolyticus]HCE4676051.1 hypothetical protein [Vibrio parahaemolyticus]HCG7256358.1 hypothetical protein [Vibrio parahaemolyticus]
MHDQDMNLDELLDDDFFDDLGEPVKSDATDDVEVKPDWVGNEDSTTYKAWLAINELKSQKIDAIKKCKKPSDRTPKSVYQLSKSEVSKLVGISAQSIFRTSSFSESILIYFDEVNAELQKHFDKKKARAINTQNTGVRAQKKEQLVKTYQQMETELDKLKKSTTKDLLDSVTRGLPLDLRRKLNL